MKPDRKQPARSPALPTRTRNQQPSQSPLQGQDWYVIADEGELTLRISNGLRVGEDRWGELTLNHPLSAHRWLEFTIDDDGELWCRSSRKDIAIRCNGEVQADVLLDAGVPIHLPHNLLHISNHIRRGRGSDWALEVGLLDDNGGNLANFDELIDTQADVTPVPESQEPDSANDQTEPPQAAANQLALPANTTGQESANDSVETFIPTLETVVVEPRAVASDEAGPAIERAVAKLKDRSKTFGEKTALGQADSTESALVPVDANGPFHTDEIRAALQQPINVGEPRSRAMTGDDQPIYSPSVTTTTVSAVADSRFPLIAAVAVAVLLILGVALFAAITATPNDEGQRPLAPSNRTAKVAQTQPKVASQTPQTAEANVQAASTDGQSRTRSLLQTATALLSSPQDLQADTLDFAIRSLNLVLAAQPDNLQAQRLLATAEQLRLQRSAQPTQQSPTAPVPAGVSDNNIQPAQADQYTLAPTSDPANRVVYQDPRLARAAERIAQGAILTPREGSAVALIMSVLAENPRQPDAVRLLNRSASVLVAQADEEYETLGVYAARNTLEEVLSFHPKHGPANQRWRSWVYTSAPSAAVPQEAVSLEDTP